MKGLADAGHDVTVITPNLDLELPKNGTYTTVHLTGFYEIYQEMLKDANFVDSDVTKTITSLIDGHQFPFPLVEKTLSHINVQNLLNSNEKFDVVIVEAFFNEALFAFAHHYKAPLVLFSAIGVSPRTNNMVGNPEPYSYIPHYDLAYSTEMSFFQRVYNALFYLAHEISDYFYFLPQHEAVMKKYFPEAPSIYDIYYNASLLLINSHESFSQSVPLVPNSKLIGGFHIKPPKALPEDLQTFLDNSPEGVVYFCLGTNVKSKDLPVFKRNGLLNAFSRLKEKVVMKWEEDHLENQPANVIVKKWLPQSDLLAHPNIKLFITHGGALGLTESIYHGVPLLVMPFFGDQHSNAKTVIANGHGLSLSFKDPEFSEEKLFLLLEELLNNPKYRENAKLRSQLFHDRPLSPMETAKYWVEFVVKFKGAPHLQVAGIRVPWYKYFLLDIIGSLMVIAGILFYAIYLIFGPLVRSKRPQTKIINKKIKQK